ncbi:error-prone DNA polymerase [Microvirga arsenatis]|uniref:Error-prone DNA polymerase n=1 Tax=Microvirga arsenatis TaxID=2692265 RepID=A0ABW9Z3Z8_9HYPH|nr:error-prone DNA polymerase [Microvirga arsenatis]NBJ13814.1 DNA polymerase III subunit alpha [Microvirga arsenatis]NBJ27262.1 DNA polymerase III subunit alpha [Microvirga arsenatis]
MTVYADLQVTTHFSFLRGASSPAELFEQAKRLGIAALGITDRSSLAGIVRAYEAATDTGVRLVVGCRLDLTDGTSLLVYPTDRPAYSRLCRLLSIGKSRGGKGKCFLTWDDVVQWNQGLLAILLGDEANDTLKANLSRMKATFGNRAYMALIRRFAPNEHLRLYYVEEAAKAARVPTVAVGDILYHHPDRRRLQDVVTCIREGCTIDTAGYRLERNSDRHLKDPAEMQRLFERHPGAFQRIQEILDRCTFSLDELRYQYPSETGPGETAQEKLERLTWEGANRRYPDGIPDQVAGTIRHELHLIEKLEYAPYFLTVNAIVQFARSRGILCQGRGSAANSAVCYVLGITSIKPTEHDLLFERFVSEERREPPDIDVDFEHERREEVIQWIYDTYGRHRAALTGVVICYRARGAVREVGKVMGLPGDVTSSLAGLVWGWGRDGVSEKEAQELNLNLNDPRLRMTLELASELIGTPRHLSQHPGGFVLTQDRLDDLVPIEPAAMENRQVIEWDKNDIDILKFMKVDVLGLGMLGCLRRAFDLLREHKGEDREIATIPMDDAPTYRMIQRADTVGVFQIESRAQMAMLPRIRPAKFYDIVIQVAIVRPGPIQGDMVHPYLRRREGREKPEYPRPELKRVLEKTLGVPLFQEQAMRVAIECAGFTASEADQLRRAMATFKLTVGVTKFRDKLVQGMVARGYDAEFAERTFKQLEGFGSYGFPESHAASFAKIAYASSWMKCHHPDVFCCAILNSQPMGFYAPAQLVRDALNHGVEIRPVDINHSRWECTLEPTRHQGRFAVRLGFCLVRGLANADGGMIPVARGDEPYTSIEDLWRRAGLSVSSLEHLAEADAFESLKINRRDALWEIKGSSDEPLPLFAAADARENTIRPEGYEPKVELAPMTEGREVVEDYRSKGLTLRQHPLAFLREELTARKICSCADLRQVRDGSRVAVAGLVLVRQKPGSAKGVMFMTIEDETDVANIIVWPSLFEKYRRLILSSNMIGVRGRYQREGGVTHLIAENFVDLSDLLRSVSVRDDFAMPHGRGDEAKIGTRDRLRAGAKEGSEAGAAATYETEQIELRFKPRHFH